MTMDHLLAPDKRTHAIEMFRDCLTPTEINEIENGPEGKWLRLRTALLWGWDPFGFGGRRIEWLDYVEGMICTTRLSDPRVRYIKASACYNKYVNPDGTLRNPPGPVEGDASS